MFDEARQPIHTVLVDNLLPADSPRLEGLNEEHLRVLADSEREFEPILVHRESGRVVDGMHRLQASILRGKRKIAVWYVDGAPEETFIRSVQTNINHGLPLTLRDRKAAVVRILATHPHWSDRAIATVAGVSPKTVGAARRRLSTEESPQSNPSAGRTGRDGRVRPDDMRERRERALVLLAQQPSVTLREVALEAGVSVSTAHRLRHELRSRTAVPDPEAQQPVPQAAHGSGDSSPLTELVVAATQRGLANVPTRREMSSTHVADMRTRALKSLSDDPSIRFTDSGRALLRWLNGQARWLADSEQLMASVPPHCVQTLAEVAHHYARAWEQFALELQQLQQLERTNGSLRAVP
ncbi:transcriptional regulator [Streptomyces sp. N2-109]|uniref:Transcriptional regulator n=1 Tax=Streptomyces gossypii TaxID=2883101 RepID=A0ABT2JPJ2_9ACTN|nr:transcriptional regulator [Streptomyces gossypii]MCT2589638.1 transcriptional regulator [Streptomyces gossypii]